MEEAAKLPPQKSLVTLIDDRIRSALPGVDAEMDDSTDAEARDKKAEKFAEELLTSVASTSGNGQAPRAGLGTAPKNQPPNTSRQSNAAQDRTIQWQRRAMAKTWQQEIAEVETVAWEPAAAERRQEPRKKYGQGHRQRQRTKQRQGQQVPRQGRRCGEFRQQERRQGQGQEQRLQPEGQATTACTRRALAKKRRYKEHWKHTKWTKQQNVLTYFER